MNIIYMATADIACPVLDALHAAREHHVVAVISQPDRASGRKRLLTPSPVKQRAAELGIPVLTPEKIGSEDSLEALQALAADLFVVFAYGQYIPASVTDLPELGSINIHPSLLPKYRGASPIQFTLLNGDTMGGVSVIYVAAEMDAGDILGQVEVAVAPADTTATLSDKMATTGAALILDVISQLAAGTAQPKVQDSALVTETRKLSKEDGRIEWAEPAETLHNKVRAYNPWPSAYFTWNDQVVKVHQTQVESGRGEPGQVLEVEGGGPLIATGEGALRILLIQPPGKKAMAAADFLRGYSMQKGERLGG